jgi:hypothetical protein
LLKVSPLVARLISVLDDLSLEELHDISVIGRNLRDVYPVQLGCQGRTSCHDFAPNRSTFFVLMVLGDLLCRDSRARSVH